MLTEATEPRHPLAIDVLGTRCMRLAGGNPEIVVWRGDAHVPSGRVIVEVELDVAGRHSSRWSVVVRRGVTAESAVGESVEECVAVIRERLRRDIRDRAAVVEVVGVGA